MAGVTKTIAVLKGDGIGPEVTSAAIQILEDCAKCFEHKFEFREFAFGGAAIARFGVPLPDQTLAGCRAADAILLGAIGGPQWDSLPLENRPEAGLLKIRKELGLFINLRPIRLRSALRGISPLRRDRIADCDFEIVRELAGDIYFGAHEIHGTGDTAFARDVAEYSVAEIERIARYAFERKQFGKAIGEFQAVQFSLAEMAIEIEATRLMVYNCARLKDNGLGFLKEAAMCKYFASQVAERVASQAVEIFGGYGFVKDYPVEKYYRDAKIGKIYEGTSNMQLATIAKLMLGNH